MSVLVFNCKALWRANKPPILVRMNLRVRRLCISFLYFKKFVFFCGLYYCISWDGQKGGRKREGGSLGCSFGGFLIGSPRHNRFFFGWGGVEVRGESVYMRERGKGTRCMYTATLRVETEKK